MLGNLSIRSKLLALLGATGLAATAGERSGAAEERRVTAVIVQAAAAVLLPAAALESGSPVPARLP